MKWMIWLRAFERAALTAWYALRDPRVPLSGKLIQMAGLVYLFLPVDIIPDFIPILGMLDDMAILPLFTALFFRTMPQNLLAELRARAAVTVDRWGNKVLYALLAAVLVWVILAVVGGYLLLRSSQTAT